MYLLNESMYRVNKRFRIKNAVRQNMIF